jgi:hypothetical protein
MRRVRITLGLAVALVALGVSAASALAAEEFSGPEFSASKLTGKGEAPFPLKLKGVSVGPQEFIMKKIRVVCTEATAKGSIPSATSQTFELIVSYKGCTTGPIVIFGKKTEVPMKLKEKGEYTFHYNGFVENEEEIEMKAKFVKCEVDLDSGTIPEKAEEKPTLTYNAVLFSNEAVANANVKAFPSGFQHKVVITNQLKGMEFEEEGGGACEDLELVEGEGGKLSGKILVEVPSGNIEGPETGPPAEA